MRVETGCSSAGNRMKTLARPGDAVEIRQRLRKLRPESARRWGTMSSHQMVCHLIDAARMMMGDKQVSYATGLPQRTIVKWTALYLPLPWPAGILTRPELDQRFGGRKPADFAVDISELEALLDSIPSKSGGFEGRMHPIFGRLSESAWLRWAYRHMDHHLRQFGV
jgi:Protein of unknown function (DUF1569)